MKHLFVTPPHGFCLWDACVEELGPLLEKSGRFASRSGIPAAFGWKGRENAARMMLDHFRDLAPSRWAATGQIEPCTSHSDVHSPRFGETIIIRAAAWRAFRARFEAARPPSPSPPSTAAPAPDAPDAPRAFPAPDDGAPAAPHHPTPGGESRSRGGRPPHHARQTFRKAMTARANHPDGLGDLAECTRAMTQWAEAKFGNDAPSESTIRAWVREDWPED